MPAPPSDRTDKNLRVLIVGRDRTLEDELLSAMAAVPGRRATVHLADTYREAVDAARRRQPDFVLIEIDRDVTEITDLLRDLLEQVPHAAMAGAFTPDWLTSEQSERAAFVELVRADMRDFIRRPLSGTELRAVLDRLFSRKPSPAAVAQGRVASFMSNKGGVGKSALAVNTACGLAMRHPDEVLLIDTSLQVGTCAFLLDLKPTTSIVDAIRERDRLDRTLLRHLSLRHPSGLRLLAAPADALEGSEVDDEAIVRIVTMARTTFKYVVIDTFPVLDGLLMTILDLTDVAFVVVQGTAPAVAATARLLPMLDGLGVPAARQRLVLNYNYRPFLGNLRPADIAGRLQRDIDFVVPYDKRVLVSMNTGNPPILKAGRWQSFGRTIQRIIDAVDGVSADALPDSRSDLDLRVKPAAAGPAVDDRLA